MMGFLPPRLSYGLPGNNPLGLITTAGVEE